MESLKGKETSQRGKWVMGGFSNCLFDVEMFLSLLTMLVENVLHLKLFFPAEIPVLLSFPNVAKRQTILFI